MGLGYALLHPVEVETTAGDYPWKQRFDDGVDIVGSILTFGDLAPFVGAFTTELTAQVDDLTNQLSSLTGPNGPFAILRRLPQLLDGSVDLAGIVRPVAEFLCDLDPTVLGGMLTAAFDSLIDGLPGLGPADIARRLRALAQVTLGVLEAPLLSGRDDCEAHRLYRAAALLRALLGDSLDHLEELLVGLDPGVRLRELLTGVPTLDASAVEGLRTFGCTIKEKVLPLLECAAGFNVGLDVDVGPNGMPDAIDDTKTMPFAPGHPVWIADLATNILALAFTIYEVARVGNPPARVTHFLHDLLSPIWVTFRLIVRATGAEFMDTNVFTKFLFSEWGDFCVELFLNLFAGLSDHWSFSNFMANVGFRLCTWHFYRLQIRAPYLFLRAAYLWNSKPATIPFYRFAWLCYFPAWFLSNIVGWILGGAATKWVSVRRFPMSFIGMGLAIASFIVFGSVVGWGKISGTETSGFAVSLALLGVFLLAVLQFSQVAEFERGPGPAILGVVIAVLAIALAIVAGVDFADVGDEPGALKVAEWISVAVGACAIPGILPVMEWWYAIAQGNDFEDVFEGLDQATSPYRLPWDAGDIWLCGQGMQGFWSHQQQDGAGFTDDFNAFNMYSYDFCERRGADARAARAGLVSSITDNQETGNPNTPNELEVQHLGWTAGHDPGWEDERQLTYSTYLHLTQRGVLGNLGQLVQQGQHVAEVDDTGNSAMEHLHYNSAAGPSRNNLPVVFEGVGRPRSTSFYKSNNTTNDALAVADVAIPLGDRAGGPAPPTPHTHVLRLRRRDLDTGGTIPASVVLTTDTATPPGAAAGATAGPGHVHRLTLTADQVRQLLRRRSVAGVDTTGAGGHAHTTQDLALSTGTPLPDASVAVATPPAGRVLARRSAPYPLLGEQLFLRISGRATEWFTWGAHRPRVAGDLTLDRGPAPGGGVMLGGASRSTPAHLMARAAAAALSSGDVTVRVVPVLVVETRQRGTGAGLTVTAAPDGLDPVVAAGTGSGSVPDLRAVTTAQLRALFSAALTQRVVPAVSAAGTPPALQVGGAPVTTFGGTPRLADVVRAAGDSGANAFREQDLLPASTGVLALTGSGTIDVPVVAAPARVVLPDRAAVRLAGADLAAEPLIVQVGADPQAVAFVAGDDSADGVARRITAEAEGVRAWAEGTAVVVETVGAGTAVTLQLTKGSAAFPPAVPASAPLLDGGRQVADSTALAVADLAAALVTAQAEAVKPTAAATVGGAGGSVVITAATNTDTVAITGPAALMAALLPAGTVPAGAPTHTISAVAAVSFTGLGMASALPTGGWFDVAVGATAARRVHLAAEPARVELALRFLPAPGTLRLQVGGTALDVALAAADVASRSALAARIADASGGQLIVRTAYRYVFERSRWGHTGGDLVVGEAAGSPRTLAAGLTAVTATDAARRPTFPVAANSDPTAAVQFPNPGRQSEGPVTRSFTATRQGAGTAAERVELAAAGGGNVTVRSLGSDPLGLDPAGTGTASATPTVAGATRDLVRSSVAYDVTASGATTVTVEMNAGPAQLHVTPPLPDVVLADGGSPLLLVRTTDPTGQAREATVDLTSTPTLAAAAVRLQQDAPHVVAWATAGTPPRLDVETPRGGTAWRLHLEGADALEALGFDRRLLDAAGGIEVTGSGNVADGQRATAAELADVFATVGGLATLAPASAYQVARSGTTLTVSSTAGAVSLTSEPPELVTGLGAGAPGGVVNAPAGGFAVDPGWLTVNVGGQPRGTARIWGRRAWLESPNPLGDTDVAAFATVAGATVSVSLNGGGAVAVAVPASVATADDLVSLLTLAVPGAWFGRITRPDGSQVLRAESRRRGSASSIRIDLSAAGLGFPTTSAASPATGPGSAGGSVADLDAVTAFDLESLLTAGRGSTRPQALVDAAAVGTDLRVTARGAPAATLTAPASFDQVALGAPGPRADLLTGAVTTPLDSGADAADLQVSAGGTNRRVLALLRAAPARVGPMSLPAGLGTLNGRTVVVRANGTAATTTFAAVSSPNQVIDAVQRANGGRVRASLRGGALVLETIAEGSAATLQVDVGASTAIAPNRLGTPVPASASGSGDVADTRRVTLAELVAVIGAGALTSRPAIATSAGTQVRVRESTTGAGSVIETFTGRAAPQPGADSSVEVVPASGPANSFAARLATGPPQLRLDRSMGRGPAFRAAAVLPPFTDAGGAPTTRALNGDLVVTFDDNGAASDLGAPAHVRITFNGTFTASEAAAVIDAALAAAGTGCAGAYPDQSVVVETLTPGLAGTVQVPSAAQPSTASVVAALGLAAAPPPTRGWPLGGFRGHAGPARAAASWQFSPPVLNLAVAAGDTAAVTATALDAVLRGADPRGAARVGMAAVDGEGALAVDFFAPPGAGITLTLAGTALGVDLPGVQRWLGAERRTEPAFDLRPAGTMRTFRMVYVDALGGPDAYGTPATYDDGTFSVIDAGWVRPPTDMSGNDVNIPRWAPGRWLLAGRVAGARLDTFPAGGRAPAYGPGGEMIASGGSATLDGEPAHFAKIVRYWLTLTRSSQALDVLRVVRVGGRYLLDHLQRPG